jgi:hypothetical protein
MKSKVDSSVLSFVDRLVMDSRLMYVRYSIVYNLHFWWTFTSEKLKLVSMFAVVEDVLNMAPPSSDS